MPGAVITANQSTGAGAGSPGVARRDLWKTKEIELVVGTGGNSSQEWALLDKPPGSAATITNADQITATFTPDVRGTYRVQLVTNGGGPGNIAIMVLRVRFDAAGDPDGRQYVLPALGELDGESNYLVGMVTNARAWAQVFEEIIGDVETVIESVGGGSPTGAAGGDLSGTYPDPDVASLENVTSDLLFNQAVDAVIDSAGHKVILGAVSATGIVVVPILDVDNLREHTSNAGVTVEGVLLKDNQVSVDVINEKTSTAGVTLDGVLLKDSQVTTDVINEKTGGAGVTADGVLLKDSQVSTDVINEKTGAAGVTVDGVLLKDAQVSTDVINEKTAATGVTIDGVLLKDSQVKTDTIIEKTSAAGVTADGVLLKDSEVTTVSLVGTDDAAGVKVRVSTHDLFKFSYDSDSAGITLDPSRTGFFLNATSTSPSPQSVILTSSENVQLQTTSVSGRIALSSSELFFYDEDLTDQSVELFCDNGATSYFAFSEFAPDGRFIWKQSQVVGAEAARTCKIQAAKGAPVSGGTNNPGHTLGLYGGVHGTGGSGGAEGGINLGAGATDVLGIGWNGATGLLNLQQTGTIINGQASGRYLEIDTYGGGYVKIQPQGGLYLTLPYIHTAWTSASSGAGVFVTSPSESEFPRFTTVNTVAANATIFTLTLPNSTYSRVEFRHTAFNKATGEMRTHKTVLQCKCVASVATATVVTGESNDSVATGADAVLTANSWSTTTSGATVLLRYSSTTTDAINLTVKIEAEFSTTA